MTTDYHSQLPPTPFTYLLKCEKVTVFREQPAGCRVKQTTTNLVAPPWQRRIVQAACEYYVFPEDGDGDFDSITGLDDDAEVVNAVLFVLGDEDNLIQIA